LLLELFGSFGKALLASLTTDVVPAIFNVWNTVFVECLYVLLSKTNPSGAIHRNSKHLLDLCRCVHWNIGDEICGEILRRFNGKIPVFREISFYCDWDFGSEIVFRLACALQQRAIRVD
jgi:hypothetical protein